MIQASLALQVKGVSATLNPKPPCQAPRLTVWALHTHSPLMVRIVEDDSGFFGLTSEGGACCMVAYVKAQEPLLPNIEHPYH